jgi:hypothetical protein
MVRWSEATDAAGGRYGTPWRAAGFVLVALLFLTGSSLLANGLPDGGARPPQPDPAAAPAGSAPTASTEHPGTADPADPPVPTGLPAAQPIELRIPRIGVSADVINIGIGADGMVEVPPLEQAHLAGWYDRGPSPGEIGNAVVVGHVDSYATGPAVFFELGALRPGDVAEVARADGTIARFVVDGVATYPKSEFPNELIYGPSGAANLRLVTCGGRFDPVTREYPDNVVVFATLDDR